MHRRRRISAPGSSIKTTKLSTHHHYLIDYYLLLLLLRCCYCCCCCCSYYSCSPINHYKSLSVSPAWSNCGCRCSDARLHFRSRPLSAPGTAPLGRAGTDRRDPEACSGRSAGHGHSSGRRTSAVDSSVTRQRRKSSLVRPAVAPSSRRSLLRRPGVGLDASGRPGWRTMHRGSSAAVGAAGGGGVGPCTCTASARGIRCSAPSSRRWWPLSAEPVSC